MQANLIAIIALTCSVSILTGCKSEHAAATTNDLTTEQLGTVERIGSEASKTLEQNLGKQLKAALQSGGPEKALHVCQQIAQTITAQTGEELANATVTRVSLRYRNQANAPDETDHTILSEWETLISEGATIPAPKVISKPPNQAIYYKPILTKPICLKCHGDPSEFSPELTETLTRAYPQDQAVNYTENDLRGAFRVVVDLD